MNIFTMFSSSRGSKKITIGNVIKFSNYKSSVLHTELRVSTLVLFIIIRNKAQELTVFHGRQKLTSAMKQRPEK